MNAYMVETMPYLNKMGNRIYFEESGSGNHALLFIHGTAANQSYFLPQIEFFNQKYKVITVDLRGHGKSDSTESSFRISDFSNDILYLIENLCLSSVSIIGHSLGGLIALDLAKKQDKILKRIVMLDTPIFVPNEVGEQLGKVYSLFQGDGYPEALRDFAVQYFFTSSDHSSRKETILCDLARFPQNRFLAIWESIQSYNAEAAARECKIPLLYIHSASPSDLNPFRSLCPTLVTTQIPNTGHYLQLEAPEKVNGMIYSFLEDLPNSDQ